MNPRRSVSDITFQVLNYVFLFLLGFATLYPFWNLLAISFNDSLDTLRGQVYFWPNKFTLNNYNIIFQNESLLGAAFRSIARTVIGTALSVGCTTMLAYTLSRREYLLRKPINLILVVSMYVNGGLIPVYMLIKGLNMTNTFAVYIIPGLIGVFNVIIMRSYFDQLPEAIVESARIDGASDIGVLFRIVIPCSLPVLATVTLFIAVGHWNSWFDNYLYNSKDNLSLLQYELMKIMTKSTTEVMSNAQATLNHEVLRQTTPYSIRATMTIIVTVPILFVYPFLQKYFIQGITVGAVKE
ncbi:carbohydrate ABC transporter permease [Paenibacillus sp.]|jgi:putative aldouronate transport system permease protein|uniref:carbohydrate ABC transporter permease n=1 Tax=Paenibacillus sp. TaxID=58172 RepID=UPI0028322291|nr:carbohydrate ABC transporter permease [Paenibacillus sp.]MDR0271679.1 carbohydrate ABC transporter permease [Paenibacillus sp.]